MEEPRATLDYCVKCTICETFCPVSAATPLFPGPKYVGPQAERFRVQDISTDASLDYCSGCGICSNVCPQGVRIAEINARARRVMKESKGIPLRDKIISRPSVGARLARPVAPLANWTLRAKIPRTLVEKAIRVHRSAPLPRFSGRTFQRWARRRPAPTSNKRVVYFHGCSTNYFEPGFGEMTVAVLEHNGYEVVIPPQDCCGLPLQSNGLFDDARRYVRALVARLVPYARDGYSIVATSTSCGLMLKREGQEILGVEDDDLAVVAAATYDICEFLRDLHDAGELRTDLRPLPQTAMYHAPCQQRGHGIGKPALDLLSLVPELRVVDHDATCCGIAGTYGVKKEKYDIAMAVGRPLFDGIAATTPEVVACDSETCRWQIEHGSGVPSVHPVELLFRSYGLDRERKVSGAVHATGS